MDEREYVYCPHCGRFLYRENHEWVEENMDNLTDEEICEAFNNEQSCGC